jgi:multidrug transporter EmrE-like cation transporter
MATTEIPKALTVEPGSEVGVSSQNDLREPRTAISAWVLKHWWIAFAASSVSVVSGHLLIKAGLNALVPSPAGTALVARVLHELLQPQIFAGLIIYLVGTICWMKAVSQKEISFLYPLSSVNYVLVAAISAMIFHEMISVRRAAGVIVIVFGMILMTRQSGKKTA